MAEWRVLVTGSRSWERPQTVTLVLNRLWRDAGQPDQVTLVHGGAAGADTMAAAHARRVGWHVETHHANWVRCGDGCPSGDASRLHRRVGKRGEYCPTAGHRRNQAMVAAGAQVVVAFWRNHSAGTRDCLQRAHAAGLRVEPVYDCDCHPAATQTALPI